MHNTFTDEPSLLVVTCSSGVAPFLAVEIEALGFRVDHVSESAIETYGTLADCMVLNMHLRTAHRVLYALDRVRASNAEFLYRELVRIPWENYLDPHGYFSVDRAVNNPTIYDTQFASLKVKDAVVDRMRQARGCRPDSGNDRTAGACVFLHWMGSEATIYLDTTGESLSFRGYRSVSAEAPMRESLAAAVITATEWRGEGVLLNPMCGGGTLAIEAAWIAQNRPPAMLRENFAFMHLAPYEPALWTEIRRKAIAQVVKAPACRIIASDIDEAMKNATRENTVAADVAELIECETCDFMLSPVPDIAEGEPRGVIVMNPPYGGRIGDPIRLRKTYTEIGAFLEQHADAYDGFVFTGNPELAADAGLYSDESIDFYSGAIPCVLLRNPKLTDEARARYRRSSSVN